MPLFSRTSSRDLAQDLTERFPWSGRRWRLGRTGTALTAGAAVLGGLALANHLLARRAERRNPPKGRFVEVNGVRLHYIEKGSGSPIVLLHGNAVTAEDFAISGLLDRLAQRHRVIAFDRPGFGYSQRPRGTVWTAQAQAALFHAALGQMGIRKPVLVGHSWGTLVALSMALDNRLNTAAVVLLSGYYTPGPRADVALTLWPAVPVLGDILRYTVSPLLGRLLLPLAVRKMFAPAPVPARFSAGFPFSLMLRPSQIRATAADSALMIPGAASLLKRHGELAVPLTVVAGSDDKIVDTAKQSGRLHRDVPGSAMLSVGGAGHMIHHLALEQVAGAIESAAAQGSDAGRSLPRPA
ncbi:alpha/beta fold hydrolase [Roseomonas sp. BN140053]|uniref:alpha/beta fold hydrolase n=1 Tax=Roseomonas sp. BN140053 TaxID=3391898 RepID=UPI0039EAF5EE